MDNNLKIVNKHLKYRQVSLIEPAKSGYMHIAAEIDQSLFSLFLTTSSKKKKLIIEAKEWCKQLTNDNDIVSAVVFNAQLIAPGKGRLKEKSKGSAMGKYDFALLIEANNLEKIGHIKNSSAYKAIESTIKKISKHHHIATATNVKQMGSVDHKKQGVFLFNYFYADNLQQNLDVWEYSAGWFQEETGLKNSTVLLPIEESVCDYTIVNHCRWDKMSQVLPSLIFKKSFHSYVLANFYANNVVPMPVLYKLA